jgi:CRISPR-associated exonuclease Cas4
MSTNVSNEDEMLPLSGLQHLAFCPRQWALIHLEQAWVENRLTAEGHLFARARRPAWAEPARHRAHRPRHVAGVPPPTPDRPRRCRRVSSAALSVGIQTRQAQAQQLRHRAICAQALCLEQMLEIPISHGAIFYGDPRRRLEVAFTPELRERTEQLSETMHRLYHSRLPASRR